MKRTIIAIVTVVLTAWGGYAISHGGGLDAGGCHHDTKNGSYHCHR